MNKLHRTILAASLSFILPLNAYSQPIIVDESEEFALLDAQPDVMERPVEESDDSMDDFPEQYEETPLVKETNIQATNKSTHDDAILLDKLHSLQQEVQELRGQLEVQAHDLKLLQQQQVSFYKDLDARLRESSTKTAEKDIKSEQPDPPAYKKNQVSSANGSNPADEQIRYLAAYELIKNKQYDEAISSMQTFISQYPEGGYSANAEYWLGELYMVKKNYTKAIEHFETVLQNYPASSKKAASMLKLGYALAASGNMQEAKQRLQQVAKNFPDTNTAQLAKTKLQSLGI